MTNAYYQNSIIVAETHAYMKVSSATRQRVLVAHRLKHVRENIKIILPNPSHIPKTCHASNLSCK